jgi:hypothetical protein
VTGCEPGWLSGNGLAPRAYRMSRSLLVAGLLVGACALEVLPAGPAPADSDLSSPGSFPAGDAGAGDTAGRRTVS